MLLHIMNFSNICCMILMGLSFYPCYASDVIHRNNDNTVKSDAIKSKPNIVLLVADDMGWGDLGANWPWAPSTVGSLVHSNAQTVTPNMDNLAKEGLRFTDFHAAASVCTPSRSALLTSRLGLRTGVVQNFGVEALGGLPNNETTVATVLLEAGYRTAMFGKWHLGLMKGHHPLDHGFQSYLGVPYSIDMGCSNPPGLNLPQCSGCSGENDVSNWNCNSQNEDSHGPSFICGDDTAIPLLSNRSVIHQPVKLSKLSTFYGDFAENFILSSTKNSPPFFLYGAFSHVHVPLLAENGTNRRNKAFKEALKEMDDVFGRIVRAVDTLKSSTKHSFSSTQETLIWFLSDNGPWEVKCELSGSWGPFSGEWQRKSSGGGASKQTVWEGGHRVPSFIHWPSHIKGGKISNALVSALDIMPTLAAITGADLPKNRLFDGQDISDILMEKNEVPDHGSWENAFVSENRVLYHPNSGASGHDGDIGAIRIGNYKAVFFSGGAPDCSGYFPPRANHSEKPLIFDLSDDPAEAHPLSSKSEEYNWVKLQADKALHLFYSSLKVDNTSIADFSTDPAARPCCNTDSVVCRCPWD